MYRFVKDNSSAGASKRLFVQGTTGNTNSILGPPIVTNLSNPNDIESLQAVFTKRKLSTEVLGSSIESTKTSRKNEDGTRRITTKIIRKVTTLTRGEEQSKTQDLLNRASTRSIANCVEVIDGSGAREVRAKRVKVCSVSYPVSFYLKI